MKAGTYTHAYTHDSMPKKNSLAHPWHAAPAPRPFRALLPLPVLINKENVRVFT